MHYESENNRQAPENTEFPVPAGSVGRLGAEGRGCYDGLMKTHKRPPPKVAAGLCKREGEWRSCYGFLRLNRLPNKNSTVPKPRMLAGSGTTDVTDPCQRAP